MRNRLPAPQQEETIPGNQEGVTEVVDAERLLLLQQEQEMAVLGRCCSRRSPHRPSHSSPDPREEGPFVGGFAVLLEGPVCLKGHDESGDP